MSLTESEPSDANENMMKFFARLKLECFEVGPKIYTSFGGRVYQGQEGLARSGQSNTINASRVHCNVLPNRKVTTNNWFSWPWVNRFHSAPGTDCALYIFLGQNKSLSII